MPAIKFTLLNYASHTRSQKFSRDLPSNVSEVSTLNYIRIDSTKGPSFSRTLAYIICQDVLTH